MAAGENEGLPTWLPLINLHSFDQDELEKLAKFCGKLALAKFKHIPVPKLDRTIFNESTSSKIQTYRHVERPPKTVQVETSFQNKIAHRNNTTPGNKRSHKKGMGMPKAPATAMPQHRVFETQKFESSKGPEKNANEVNTRGFLLTGRESSGRRRRQFTQVKHTIVNEDDEDDEDDEEDNDGYEQPKKVVRFLDMPQKWQEGPRTADEDNSDAEEDIKPVEANAAEYSKLMGEYYVEMVKGLDDANGNLTGSVMDGKVVDAVGFPEGWTVSVTLRHKRGRLFLEYTEWHSPTGILFNSFKEAAAHAMESVGQFPETDNIRMALHEACPCSETGQPTSHLNSFAPTKVHKYACEECGHSYSSNEALRLHLITHPFSHIQNPLSSCTDAPSQILSDCSVCGKSVLSGNHVDCLDPTADKTWICKVCDRVYKNSIALAIHERGHVLAGQIDGHGMGSGIPSTSGRPHNESRLDTSLYQKGDNSLKNEEYLTGQSTQRINFVGQIHARQSWHSPLLQQSKLPSQSVEGYLCTSCDADNSISNLLQRCTGGSQVNCIMCGVRCHLEAQGASSAQENSCRADVLLSDGLKSSFDEEFSLSLQHNTPSGTETRLEDTTTIGNGSGEPSIMHGKTKIFQCPTCQKSFHEISKYWGHLACHVRRKRKRKSIGRQGSLSNITSPVDVLATDLGTNTAVFEDLLEPSLDEEVVITERATHSIFWRLLHNPDENDPLEFNHSSSSEEAQEPHAEMEGTETLELVNGGQVHNKKLSNNVIHVEASILEHHMTPGQDGAQPELAGQDVAQVDGPRQQMILQRQRLMMDGEMRCSECGEFVEDLVDLLFCDWCDRVYHRRCVSPGSQGNPESYWTCPLCEIHF